MNAPLFSDNDAASVSQGRDSDTEFTAIFVHSRLDDYGLPPSVFRVYGHLSRRAGSGTAYSSIANMARVCRLHVQTVRTALKLLAKHRLVTCESRRGKTNLYQLTPPSQWLPSMSVRAMNSDTGTALSVSQVTITNEGQGNPSEIEVAKGNPIERTPRKAIQTPPQSPKGESVSATGNNSPEQVIYEAYPKHVGKPAALRTIRRILKSHNAAYVLERTRLFANTYDGEAQFIPNPLTWFSQERFNDDPSTWRRSTSGNGGSKPAIISKSSFACGITSLE